MGTLTKHRQRVMEASHRQHSTASAFVEASQAQDLVRNGISAERFHDFLVATCAAALYLQGDRECWAYRRAGVWLERSRCILQTLRISPADQSFSISLLILQKTGLVGGGVS